MIRDAVKYRSNPDERAAALGSAEPHGIRVKLATPRQGLIPPTELEIAKTN